MTNNTTNRDTLDIETTGDTLELALAGNDTLHVVIRGDGAADYQVDVTDDPANGWINGVESGSLEGAVADYDETFTIAVPYVRIRVTSGTATAGDSADVLLSSA